MPKTLASLVLASLAAGCSHEPQVIAIPQPTPPTSPDVPHPGQMTVSGTATLDVSPDCADLTLSLSSEAAKPGTASATVQAKEKELVAALIKLGVETRDIKLSFVTLNQIYEVTKDGVPLPRVRAYSAGITLTVTTRHFEQISAILEAGGQAGATGVSSQFRNSDLVGLKKKVREMALTAAKEKAQQTADILAIKLGRVITVVENAGGMMWNQQYFPNTQARAEPAAGEPVALGGTLQPLTLEVSVGYELAKTT